MEQKAPQPASGEGVGGWLAAALKKAEQAAGAGLGGAAIGGTNNNSQFSQGITGSQSARPKPGQATPLLSPGKRQDTPFMGWVWLPISGQ